MNNHIDKSIQPDLYSSSVQQRALLLDRDGVINVNHGYVHHTENFEFIDGIFEVARAAYAKGYKLVVITNQAGIARGYYSEKQFYQLTAGAPIEKVYFSPFHPTEGIGEYKKDDFSRKPNPGMLLQARHELNLNLANSILIGDNDSDIQAGIAAGVGLNILFAQKPPKELRGLHCQAIATLLEAIPFINKSHQQRVIS
jgi:D-glycero-D-manno-heptose 1,7-bisphosphate phosphatase